LPGDLARQRPCCSINSAGIVPIWGKAKKFFYDIDFKNYFL
jgi:hypothetical protein